MIYIVFYLQSLFVPPQEPCNRVGCCVFHGSYKQIQEKQVFYSKEEVETFCYGRTIVKIDSAKIINK